MDIKMKKTDSLYINAHGQQHRNRLWEKSGNGGGGSLRGGRDYSLGLFP